MSWAGADAEHCEDTSEAPEFYERDERDLIAEESAADAEMDDRREKGE